MAIKANIIRAMLERGYRVSVIKSNGVTEKYHQLKNGDLAVTYMGASTCIYCGRKTTSYPCCCGEEIETVSMTGAFRQINSIAQQGGDALFDKKTKVLIVNERVASCV